MGRALKDSFTRALVQNLSTLLNTAKVIKTTQSTGSLMSLQVAVEVVQFDGTLGGDVVLIAKWGLFEADGKKLLLEKDPHSRSPRSCDLRGSGCRREQGCCGTQPRNRRSDQDTKVASSAGRIRHKATKKEAKGPRCKGTKQKKPFRPVPLALCLFASVRLSLDHQLQPTAVDCESAISP